MTPRRLDLLHSVTAENMKRQLSEGQLKRIDTLLRNLPWRKGPLRFMA